MPGTRLAGEDGALTEGAVIPGKPQGVSPQARLVAVLGPQLSGHVGVCDADTGSQRKSSAVTTSSLPQRRRDPSSLVFCLLNSRAP